MSSYYQFTKHPKTGKWEKAFWHDDYFAHYHYGVIFPDGDVFDPWKDNVRITINEAEATILNREQE